MKPQEQNPCRGHPFAEDQLPKVFVRSEEQSFFFLSESQDLPVGEPLGQPGHVLHLEALASKIGNKVEVYVLIRQAPHPGEGPALGVLGVRPLFTNRFQGVKGSGPVAFWGEPGEGGEHLSGALAGG